MGNRLHRRNGAASLVFSITGLVSALSSNVALLPNSVVTAKAPRNIKVNFDPPGFLYPKSIIRVAVSPVNALHGPMG